tara:strand:+ start:122 stop:373 length:252 start_codon:yes stop_codon:yes gene_type:complete
MAKSKRQFWKTILHIEILSEDEPYDFLNYEDLKYDVTDGHYSAVVKTLQEELLTPEEAAKALQKQGSDPEFFQLDEDGNEVED